MTPPIMNLDDVEFDDVEENRIYTSRRGQVSDRIGAKKLGYNLTVLPPGKVQCAFHSHHGEEEMFLILEGEGELRSGDNRFPIRKLDVIACPPGGPEVAHQIINTGTSTAVEVRPIHRGSALPSRSTRTRRYVASTGRLLWRHAGYLASSGLTNALRTTLVAVFYKIISSYSARCPPRTKTRSTSVGSSMPNRSTTRVRLRNFAREKNRRTGFGMYCPSYADWVPAPELSSTVLAPRMRLKPTWPMRF